MSLPRRTLAINFKSDDMLGL
jgi:hypothetical protein